MRINVHHLNKTGICICVKATKVKICAIGVCGSHQQIQMWGLLSDLVALQSVTNGLGMNGLECLGHESLGRVFWM